MITTRTTLTAAVATTLGPACPGAVGVASGGNAVGAGGSCSAGATWHLKAKHDDGRIEVEGEVDRPPASWNGRSATTARRSQRLGHHDPQRLVLGRRRIGNRPAPITSCSAQRARDRADLRGAVDV